MISAARKEQRDHILNAAYSLLHTSVNSDFDAIHSPICQIDVVMVAGAPWIQDGLTRDFLKDESGYRKIGGGANTPQMAYFFRSTANLVHYFKRQGFYTPRGGSPSPEPGMACFFDWEDRGRFNFSPDRSGIITKTEDDRVASIIIAQKNEGYIVNEVKIELSDSYDKALVGYSDLP